MNCKTIFAEVLVIGSGAAGLRAASALAEKGIKATVVSKGACASPEIMGFNAPVLPGDSEECYFMDVERSGYGINDSRLAKILSEKVLGEVHWLENNGVHFERDEKGNYLPIHTLGTTYARLVKAGVSTGVAEMKALQEKCKNCGVEFYMPLDILGLLKTENKVIGAYGVDKDGETVRFITKAVVLATGGCGAMQSFSTYPKPIIGDGYAMAYEAGAKLVDMEFQQFEPCCFVYPDEIRGKVIATTLLRHGAELRNGLGEPFMEKYGLTRNNAQKGNLARAMLNEVREGRGTPHGGIYYDMTMLSHDFLYVDHEIFTKPAAQVGMDLTKEMPEMMPAAHTNIGGVIIDKNCNVGVEGLYACGEVIGGLHGGNRLGGCAGAETVVFGHIAGDGAADYVLAGAAMPSEADIDSAWQKADERMKAVMTRSGDVKTEDIRKRLGETMFNNLGILRNAKSIAKAAADVEEMNGLVKNAAVSGVKDMAEVIHCENMLLLAEMQIKASDMRKESRGVYFREDYPTQNDTEWLANVVISKTDAGMDISVRKAINDTTF